MVIYQLTTSDWHPASHVHTLGIRAKSPLVAGRVGACLAEHNSQNNWALLCHGAGNMATYGCLADHNGLALRFRLTHPGNRNVQCWGLQEQCWELLP